MKASPFRIGLALASLTLLRLSAQQSDFDPVYGKVTTLRKTIIKTTPSAQGPAAAPVPAQSDLRWVMGQRSGKYLRVIVPKGPIGWVLASDVKQVEQADLTSIATEASAVPCVEPKNIKACTENKPAGCSSPGSAHGLANELKRTVPPDGDPTLLTFDSFSQLQTAAEQSVDQGVDIDPAAREALKSIEITEGTVGEGSRVSLVAFLSIGKPHANTGESVNCNLKGTANNDFHISMTEAANDSEFNGIVVEMIPQDRPAKWNLTNLSALRGKKLLIEGGLFYDNLHVANGDAGHPIQGQPARFSLWEIHPITSLKVCTKPAAECDSTRPSDWKPF
jgi:hypothetical protein